MNNAFVTQANVEPEWGEDHLEDLDLALIKQEIANDDDYLLLVKAIMEDKSPKDLPDNHPGHRYKGVWAYMSLVDGDTNSPVLIDVDKMILPRIMGKKQAVNLHKGTHGSVQQVTMTLSNFCTWENMKEDILSV